MTAPLPPTGGQSHGRRNLLVIVVSVDNHGTMELHLLFTHA